MAPPYAIGIDVGGTKTAGGLVDTQSGEVVADRRNTTDPGSGGNVVLDQVQQMALDLKAEGDSVGKSPVGVGVGIAELVDPEGCLTSAWTIDWLDLEYQERLDRILPTVVDSDIRTAALAEARFGAGRGLDSFAYVSVGTGIGGCLVLEGVPVSGARGNAMILGSGAISVPCGDCGGTASSVLEDAASGPAIVRIYNQAGGQADQCEAVFALAEAGDAPAIEVLRNAGRALGVSVGFLVNVTDPEVVIVGGGVGLAGGVYWEAFVESVRTHVWAKATRSLDILPSGLGAASGIVGAALRGLRS
jgi:glucokinase